MTKDEALRLALEALKQIDEAMPFPVAKLAQKVIKEALAQPQQEPVKLWLWKNFVDGKPEYWAFDNAFPINLNDGDPQTLGEPCGYAWLKPSRQGRFDVSDEEVLSAVQNAKEYPPQRKPLTDKEIDVLWFKAKDKDNSIIKHFARAIEAAHGIKGEA